MNRFQMPTVRILLGDCRDVLRNLPEKSVHTCITSPPYYGLRVYPGVPDSIWGGKAGCEHMFVTSDSQVVANSKVQSAFCTICGAWKGKLGNEPHPEMFIHNLVEVFREVWRVLRDDGTLWLNLGSSYAGSGKGTWNISKEKKKEKKVKETYSPDASNAVFPGQIPVGYKAKDLIPIPFLAAIALQKDGWYLRSDIIWCLAGSTELYVRTPTFVGPMTIHDMVKLKPENVQLWNGERWTQVLGWGKSKASKQDTLEIKLRSGQIIRCTKDHKWPTSRGVIEARDLAAGDVIKTCVLPNESLRPELLDDVEIGRLCGLYLAEGSKSGRTRQFAGHVKETGYRELRLRRLTESVHGTVRSHHLHGNAGTVNTRSIVLEAIIDMYIGGRNAKSKHLKSKCWARSNGFLHNLLMGYLEGDGHYDKDNDRWRIGFTRNKRLAADLRTLCARLGYQITLDENVAINTKTGKRHPSYRGEIRTKSDNSHWNHKIRSEVIGIGPNTADGKCNFWDISVADEPHTFALASGVLTHNCKPNPFPSPVSDRPTNDHEYIFLLSKKPKYYYDKYAILEPYSESSFKRINQRTFETQKGGEKDYAEGSGQGSSIRKTLERFKENMGFGRNKRSTWILPTASSPSIKKTADFFDADGVGYRAFSECSFHSHLARKRGEKRTGTLDLFEASKGQEIESQQIPPEPADNDLCVCRPLPPDHQAVFPEKLIEPCILAGSSAYGACVECGAPYRRIVKTKTSEVTQKSYRGGTDGWADKSRGGLPERPGGFVGSKSETLNWEPSCNCGTEAGVTPCTVLDPFSGSGTTALVALKNGRSAVGIDISPEYKELSEQRVQMEIKLD